MFKATGKHVPPPPNMPSPIKWGDEATVRELLHDGVADLKLTRRMCRFNLPFSPAEVVEHFRTYYGPTQRAFAALDSNGQAALRSDLEQLWAQNNKATDNTTQVDGEYLEVLATRS
jgi:hypothetical protein